MLYSTEMIWVDEHNEVVMDAPYEGHSRELAIRWATDLARQYPERFVAVLYTTVHGTSLGKDHVVVTHGPERLNPWIQCPTCGQDRHRHGIICRCWQKAAA